MGEPDSEGVQLRLLPFQQDIVEELLQQDGLTIMGAGLGMCTVAAGLLAIHHLTGDSGGVTIILGVHRRLSELSEGRVPQPSVLAYAIRLVVHTCWAGGISTHVVRLRVPCVFCTLLFQTTCTAADDKTSSSCGHCAAAHLTSGMCSLDRSTRARPACSAWCLHPAQTQHCHATPSYVTQVKPAPSTLGDQVLGPTQAAAAGVSLHCKGL